MTLAWEKERDAEGVFVGTGDSLKEAGELYPAYMKYETECGKKEGYVDIASQLAILTGRVLADYSVERATQMITVLSDTLSECSIQIYEHYRKIQDCLKNLTAETIKREGISMTEFPKAQIKSGVSGKNAESLKALGAAILEAVNREQISAEKYEQLSRALMEGMIHES